MLANKKLREVVLCIKSTGYHSTDRIEKVACIELINGERTGLEYLSPNLNIGEAFNKLDAATKKHFDKSTLNDFSKGTEHFSDIEKELMAFIKGDEKKSKTNLIVFNKAYVMSRLKHEMPSFDPEKSVNIEDVMHTGKVKFPKEGHTFDELCKKFNLGNPKQSHYDVDKQAHLLADLHAKLSDEKQHDLVASQSGLFAVASKSKETNDTAVVSHHNTRSRKM